MATKPPALAVKISRIVEDENGRVATFELMSFGNKVPNGVLLTGVLSTLKVGDVLTVVEDKRP